MLKGLKSELLIGLFILLNNFKILSKFEILNKVEKNGSGKIREICSVCKGLGGF